MEEAYIYAFFPTNSFTQPLYSKKNGRDNTAVGKRTVQRIP